MQHDPTPHLLERGYTPREAAFLFLVARLSGFFVGRQFTEFIRRERGAIFNRFLREAQKQDHIQVLRCGSTGYLYHLKSKLIYRLIGCEDSQNRRLKGDDQIKIRLMVLDYVLENSEHEFLTAEQEKVAAFRDSFGVAEEELPASPFVNTRAPHEIAVRYFADRFPIALSSRADQFETAVFTYFDHGASTTKPFRRYLYNYKALFRALGAFHLIFVADVERNFIAAAEIFNRTFARSHDGSNSGLLPFGVDHLGRFFSARQRWDNNSPAFSPEDLKYLKEGERVYRSAEHEKLHLAWSRGRAAFDGQLKVLGLQKEVNGSFKTYLLRRVYPILGERHQRKTAS